VFKMDKQTRDGLVILFVSLTVTFAIGFTAGIFAGRASVGKREHVTGCGHDGEYSRSMGHALGFIAELDDGLGTIQRGLAEITDGARQSTQDLRGLAQRQRENADRVRAMEEYIDRLRNRSGRFLADNDPGSVSELNE